MRTIKTTCLLLAWLLTGCASSIKDTSIAKNTTLAPNEGLVALEVVNNTGSLTGLIDDWKEVIVMRVDNLEQLRNEAMARHQALNDKAKKPSSKLKDSDVNWEPEYYKLEALPAGTTTTQVFFGKMPAGKYIIQTLYGSYSRSDYQAWFTKPVKELGGYFTVQPKALSDLGAIVYQPMGLSEDGRSTYSYVARLPRVHQLTEFVQLEYPKLAAQLAAKANLGWEASPLDEFRYKLGQMSRETPYITQSTPLNNEGKGALIGKMGQIKLLVNGRWIAETVPTNAEVTSMLQDGETLLVGTEQGGLFQKHGGQADWQMLHPVGLNEAITSLVRTPAHYYALTTSAFAVNVYRFDQPAGAWTLLKSFKSQWSRPHANVFVTPVGINVHVLASLYQYTEQTDQWKSKRGSVYSKVAVLAPGKWLVIEPGAGPSYLTEDFGENWIDLHRPRTVFNDAMSHEYFLPAVFGDKLVSIESVVDKQDTSLIRRDVLRLVSRPMQLVRTGNNSPWQEHGIVKQGCTELLPQISTSEKLYVRCVDGDVVSTKNLGASWETEFGLNLKRLLDQYKEFVLQLEQDIDAQNIKKNSVQN